MKPSLLLASTVLLMLELNHTPVNGFVVPPSRPIIKPSLRSITTLTPFYRQDSPTGLQAMPVALTSMQSVLHNDPSFVLSTVLLLSIFGVSLERRTTVGKALSAPLATMALALTVANLGVIPFTSPVCELKRYYLLRR